MREKLNATANTELERLLAGRVARDWLALQHAQLDLAAQLQRNPTALAATMAQRRLDRAHARFLAAGKTLATVQRLLRRAPSPLEMLRPIAESSRPTVVRDRVTGKTAWEALVGRDA